MAAAGFCALTIGILGTGRMGTHLAAVWANAGHTVILGSRTKSKADEIVDALKSGAGYRGSQGEDVPPFTPLSSLNLTGGSIEEAAAAPIIVLVTPYPATADLLASLKSVISGQGKVIIDMTNPWYSGHGLPPDGPQSAVEVHRSILEDSTASFAVAYKNILWRRIVPGAAGVQVEICGDSEAKAAIESIVKSHGFVPIDRGDLEAAASLEPGRR